MVKVHQVWRRWWLKWRLTSNTLYSYPYKGFSDVRYYDVVGDWSLWCDVMYGLRSARSLCYIILFTSSISIRYHIAVQYSVSKFNILYLVATPFSMPVFDVCPWFILAICYVCLLYMKVPWSKAPAALGGTYIIKCKILIPDPNLPGKAQWAEWPIMSLLPEGDLSKVRART